MIPNPAAQSIPNLQGPTPQAQAPMGTIGQDPQRGQISEAGDAVGYSGANLQVESRRRQYEAERMRFEAERLQDKLDNSDARSGLTQLGFTQSQLLVDPNDGFLWTAGRNALERRPQVLGAFGERIQAIEGQLQTQRAKQVFRQGAELRALELMQRVDAHAGRAANEFADEADQNELDQASQEAIDAHGLPGIDGVLNSTYRVRKDIALGAFDRLAERKGLRMSDPNYRSLRFAVTGRIAAGVVDRLAEKDPFAAQDYVDSLRDIDVSPGMRAKMQEKVTDQGDQRLGVVAAGEMLRQFNDPDVAAASLFQAYSAPGSPISERTYSRAQKEIAQQAEGVRRQKAAAETQAMEIAKRWLIGNPTAGWDDLPVEYKGPVEKSFQRDNLIEWLKDDKRVATNPAAYAALQSMPDAYWRNVTDEELQRDWAGQIAPEDMKGVRAQSAVAKGSQDPGAKDVVDAKDLDRIAAFDGLIFDNPDLPKQPPGQELIFLKFQARTDELVKVYADEKDPKRRRELARQAALREKDSAGNFVWNKKPEERAAATFESGGENFVPANVVKGSTYNEVHEAYAQMAEEQGIPSVANPALRRLFTLREQRNQDLLPGALQSAVEKQMRVAMAGSINEFDLAKRIVENKAKRAAEREADRRLYPGTVSWLTLQRHGLIKDSQSAEDDITAGTVPAYADDIVTRHRRDRDQGVAASNSGGLSLAAGKRMEELAGKTVGPIVPGHFSVPRVGQTETQSVVGIMSARERDEAIQRLEALTFSKYDDVAAQNLERDLQQVLANGGRDHDPAVRFLRARTAFAAKSVVPSNQQRIIAERAWEAWLQDGGEYWEEWEQSGKPKASMPLEGTWEQHVQFRAKVAQWGVGK
jgi:hypothetical protein